jgi:NAD(P)-dependent dehydrogenase (short-subunit alcohol dehydrogenase family)
MGGSDTRRQLAVVTGASSGIGRATAIALAGQGWNLVLVGRALQSLLEVEADCHEFGIDTLVAVADVGEQEEVDRVFGAAFERFGRVDAVVNSAAAVGYGRFEDVPAEVFDRVIVTNLLGTANVARASLRRFREQGGGHLVLLGSLLGKIAVPFMSPYVTSKWGVHGLARILQIEARQTPGIDVSVVSPGSVNTPAYLQAANYAGWEGRPPPPIDPPEKVARAIVRTLGSPRRDRSVGVANHVVVLGFRLLPAVFDALVTPLMRLGGLSKRPLAPHSGSVLEPQPAGEAAHGPWARLGRRTGSAADAPVPAAPVAAGARTG